MTVAEIHEALDAELTLMALAGDYAGRAYHTESVLTAVSEVMPVGTAFRLHPSLLPALAPGQDPSQVDSRVLFHYRERTTFVFQVPGGGQKVFLTSSTFLRAVQEGKVLDST